MGICFGCLLDASLGRCFEHVQPEQCPQTQYTVGIGIAQEELEEVAGEGEFWASLLKLLLL